jgi:hypothetical protein
VSAKNKLWNIVLSGLVTVPAEATVIVSAPPDATMDELQSLCDSMAACAHVTWRDAGGTPLATPDVDYESCEIVTELRDAERTDFVLARLPNGKLALQMARP